MIVAGEQAGLARRQNALDSRLSEVPSRIEMQRDLANQKAELVMWMGGIMIAGLAILVSVVIAVRPRD